MKYNELGIKKDLMVEATIYDLRMYQRETNQIHIKIRECDIYEFIRERRTYIKFINIDFEKKDARITFLDEKDIK